MDILETLDPQISIEIVYTVEELKGYISVWDELANAAIDQNIFYESGAFLSAVVNLGMQKPLCCLFVFHDRTEGDENGRNLIGFIPFQKSAKGPKGLIPCYELFNHLHCYLSSPLIHCDHIQRALDALQYWMDTTPNGVRLFGLYNIVGEGALANQLFDTLRKNKRPNILEANFQRAFLRIEGELEDFLTSNMSRKKRKEYRRLHRRLEENGPLNLQTVTCKTDSQAWVRSFLQLESSGWKARTGHALGRTRHATNFFKDFVTSFANKERVRLHSLSLNGRPIAMKCNIISANGKGSFAFKIAYDETQSAYSPGIQLELENITDLFSKRHSLTWMDSCADPGHPMIDHLWRERRKIIYIMCSSKGLFGRTLIGLFQLRNFLVKRT